MKWFQNLKMKQKLISCFFLVALFIGIVGFIGISNMGKINANSNDMYNNNMHILEDLMTINSNTLHIRLEIINLVEGQDSGEVKKTEDTVQNYRDQNDQLLQEYLARGLTVQEKEIYAQLQIDQKDYRNACDNIIKLMSGQKYAEAMTASKQSASIRDELTTSIDKLIKVNEQQAADSINKNNSLYKNSYLLMVFISLAGLIMAVILGLIVSSLISKNLKQLSVFAEALESGDLTQNINIDSKDEIGAVAKALNQANINVRKLISEIISGAEEISATSEELSAATQEFTAKMELVNTSTEQISNGIQDLSSITEEVSASAQEIGATTGQLAARAGKSAVSAGEIQKRAMDIKSKAAKNIEDGNIIYEEKRSKIVKAVEDGEVVKEVKNMADSIGNIASQTNLLALNAAIEAARAGEQGRGFAVVAEEVRKLAEHSVQAVISIQNMVEQVQAAFENLSESGQEVLEYLANNVKPSYQLLMDTGMQYETDAEFVNSMSEEIAISSRQIDEIVGQVNTAIQNVSATAEESAAGSEEILRSIHEITSGINDVSQSAQSQAELAQKLNSMVRQFKI